MATERRAKEPYHGFVVEFEPERSGRLSDWLAAGYDISDSFSADDWALRRKEIFFVASPASQEPQYLLAASYVERMHGTGGTRKPKFRITHPVVLHEPLSLHELTQLGTDISGRISNPSRGKRLALEEWQKLIEAVLALRASQAQDIKALLELVERDTEILGGTNRLDRLAEQRDAVGSVLDIAGLDRAKTLKEVDATKAESADTFFDLLSERAPQERTLIEHDVHWLQVFLEGNSQERTFFDPGSATRVKVHITDKEPLETALGVDLLIYQSLYNSLIFVQYKGMHKEDGEGWLYRPDDQFDRQLASMFAARTAMTRRTKETTKQADFRLNDEPFYFKFCERRKPDAAEASLVRGMSMNAIHVKDFLQLPQARGPREGRQIGYKNCFRYLNNSEFVALAKGGWTGTSAAHSEFMKEVVAASLEGKRALVAALIQVPEMSTAQLRKAGR